MRPRNQIGFTLIELLIVVSILGMISAAIYVLPKGLGGETPELHAKQLQNLLISLRQQAIRNALPRKIVRRGNSLYLLRWSPTHNGWTAPSDESTQTIFSTHYSLELEKPHRAIRYNSQQHHKDIDFLTASNEQSLIFWSDGTSTGAKISLMESGEEPRYLSVSKAGKSVLR